MKETYGSDAEDDSSSESEDEFAEALNPKLEKQFFRLLAKVKTKDPILYDKEEKFFSDRSYSSDIDSEVRVLSFNPIVDTGIKNLQRLV